MACSSQDQTVYLLDLYQLQLAVDSDLNCLFGLLTGDHGECLLSVYAQSMFIPFRPPDARQKNLLQSRIVKGWKPWKKISLHSVLIWLILLLMVLAFSLFSLILFEFQAS